MRVHASHPNKLVPLRRIAALRSAIICALLACEFTARARDDATNAPPSTNAVVPVSESETNIMTSDDPRHSKVDFEARVVTNAPAGAIVSTNATAPAEKNFHWSLDWRGWDGLHWGLSESTRLKPVREMLGLEPTTNESMFHIEQLKMSGKIGGRFEVDGAAYEASQNLDVPNAIGWRRARIIIQGDCILIVPFTYKIEIGYIPHRFNLNQAWLSSDHIDYIGYIVGGVFQPPMGLDMITSSRDLTLMEPASMLQALAPSDEAGIQIGQPVFNKRGTWSLGVFSGVNSANEYGNDSADYGNLIGRFSYLAIDHINPKKPEDNEYLHLAISANTLYSGSSVIRYRSRPESYFATHLIDTGNINANGSGGVGAEAAYVRGPWCFESEFLDSVVREVTDEKVNFYGAYAAATWFLTGESRPYNRDKGCFARLVPERNLDFDDDDGWGALALSARVSYTDLTEGNVRGGKMGLLMTGLNWYPHSHVRWMFDIGGGNISGGAHDGNILILQSRIGIDF